MKKYIIGLLGIVLLISLTLTLMLSLEKDRGVQKQSSTKERVEKAGVQKIEIGKTYQFKDASHIYFKLTDEDHFVWFIDDARYSSQEDLESYRLEQEDMKIYPQFSVVEGTIKKEGSTYHFTNKRKTTVTFKDVTSIDKKIISQKMNKDLNQYSKERITTTLTKTTKGYATVGQSKEDAIVPSSRELPDSIDDFLSKYKYVPEKLD